MNRRFRIVTEGHHGLRYCNGCMRQTVITDHFDLACAWCYADGWRADVGWGSDLPAKLVEARKTGEVQIRDCPYCGQDTHVIYALPNGTKHCPRCRPFDQDNDTGFRFG